MGAVAETNLHVQLPVHVDVAGVRRFARDLGECINAFYAAPNSDWFFVWQRGFPFSAQPLAISGTPNAKADYSSLFAERILSIIQSRAFHGTPLQILARYHLANG
jgi:hypothetical protein